MNKLIAILVLSAIIVFASSCLVKRINEPQINYSRAAVIAAQGQARMDTAAAMLPYAVIGASVVTGLTVLATGLTLFFGRLGTSQHQPQRIERIETRTVVFLTADGMSRREMYQLISGADEVKRIGGGHNG